jgi:hypothetical protein
VIARGGRADLPPMDELLEVYELQFGATIVEDRRYDLERFELELADDLPGEPTLDDVLAAIRAPALRA